MAYEHREGSGSLFKNTKKEEGSRQPDYRGDAMVNGEVMEVSAWIKENASGGKFFSLSIKPKQAQREEKPAPERKVTKIADLDSDLPF